MVIKLEDIELQDELPQKDKELFEEINQQEDEEDDDEEEDELYKVADSKVKVSQTNVLW